MSEQEYNKKMRLEIDTIVIHHSDTKRDWDLGTALNAINNSHKDRLHKELNGNGHHVAYHYLIAGGGKILYTRPEDEVGYHAGHWTTNRKSIGVCFLGKFEEEKPNPQQLTAARQLIREIKCRHKIKNIAGHRTFKPTKCPGKNMTDDMIYKLI